MNTTNRITTALGLGLCLIVFAPQAAATTGPSSGHALLVGCTTYPDLDDRHQLEGPIHDVGLMHTLLTGSRFGFERDRVVALTGWKGVDEGLRPTRSNILRELEALTDPDRVSAGDHVVIFLAGHGSLLPADADPDDPENDGFDELFLPSDVGPWESRTRTVRNAITDDEIRDVLDRIRALGAHVWFIADTCYSGTMTRGPSAEYPRTRRVPSDALAIPDEVMDTARRAGSGWDTTSLGFGDEPDRPGQGGLVAMYATRSFEATLEDHLPGEEDRVYGLFTYHLSHVLQTARTPMTYREVMDHVQRLYRAQRRLSPIPMIEGSAQNREVLGLREWPDRPAILLEATKLDGHPTTFRLAAGHLQGMTRGAILAVYPPAGAVHSDRVVGHVEITDLHAVTATVAPVAYGQALAPRPAVLLDGSRCEVVFIDFGDGRLKVALQSTPGYGGSLATHATGTGPADLEAIYQEAEASQGDKKMFRRVDDEASAQWLVRLEGDRLLLVPTVGWVGPDPSLDPSSTTWTKQFEVGLDEDAGKTAADLAESLGKLAAVQQLLAIAGAPDNMVQGETAPPPDITVDLFKVLGGEVDASCGEVTLGLWWDQGTLDRRVRVGERIQVGWETKTPVDLGVLYVDANMGINVMFPARQKDSGMARITPGDESNCGRFRITDGVLGVEHLVVIAVAQAGTEPPDWHNLVQTGLKEAERTRSSKGTRGDEEHHPLEHLLDRAMHLEGTTRGLTSADRASYRIWLYSWTTVPAE